MKTMTEVYDGSPYHIETSPLICSAKQWTCFFMIGTSVMKELRVIERAQPNSATKCITLKSDIQKGSKLSQTNLEWSVFVPFDCKIPEK